MPTSSAANAGNPANANRGASGAGGNSGRGPSGTTRDGLEFGPPVKKPLRTIPDVPESDGGGTIQPAPFDLSALQAPQAPQRRALSGISAPVQAGVTG
jgi:hypothetical protein